MSDDFILPETPPAAAEPNRCTSCGQEPQAGYAMPLCAGCRRTLAARPIPRGILIATGAVLLGLLGTCTELPSSLAAGVAFRRGQLAEGRGNFHAALQQYQGALARSPNSRRLLVRVAVAGFRAHAFQPAIDALQRLNGEELSEDMLREVNPVVAELNKLADKAEAKGRPQRKKEAR